MSRSLLELAHRVIRAWQAHRDARQRQARFARLCRVAPELSAASQRLSRDRKHHKPTRADMAAMRDAMTAELRKEMSHG